MNSVSRLLNSILVVANFSQKLLQSVISFLAQAAEDHQSFARSLDQVRREQADGFSRMEKLIGDPDADAQASPELTGLADHLEEQAAKLSSVVDLLETFVNQNPGTKPVK